MVVMRNPEKIANINMSLYVNERFNREELIGLKNRLQKYIGMIVSRK